MTRIWATLTVAAILLSAGAAASGAAFDPPSWAGSPGSAHQEWEFATNASPPIATAVTNVYGTPSATVTVGPFNSGWWDCAPDVFGSQQGFWDLGAVGTFVATVPNDTAHLEYKEVWVQVTYLKDVVFLPPTVTVDGAAAYGPAITPVVIETAGTATWCVGLTKWRITPNPSSERITLTAGVLFGAVIDKVVIDTYAYGTKVHPIPGDADLNCTVNLLDLLFVRNRLTQSPSSGDNWSADVNGDGNINLLDLLFVRDRLNNHCP